MAWFAWPLVTLEMGQPIDGRAAGPDQFLSTATPFLIATSTPERGAEQRPEPTPDLTAQIQANAQSQFILSLSEEGLQHLYSFDSKTLELQRITNTEASDEAPALHPSGLAIAYASNSNGQWDLFALDLVDGSRDQLTGGSSYEGQPSWSGDGGWLVYERYQGENLDIFMLPADESLEPVQLTQDQAADHSPSWAPNANVIAFVSERNGFEQVWLLNLDQDGERRFQPLNQSETPMQRDPAWSPDGRYLAWSAFADGFWRIYTLDMELEDAQPFEIGLGEQPAWSPDGSSIAVIADGASESFLLAYDLNGQLVFPAVALPGDVQGIAWGAAFANEIPESLQANAQPQRNDWGLNLEATRLELVDVQQVEAEYAELISPAELSFAALRDRLNLSLGWDVLSHLEALYLPLSVPHDPLLAEDWSYTGRSFSLLKNLIWTDWMRVVREPLNGEDYWRVYLRPVDELAYWGKPLTGSVNLLNPDKEGQETTGYWVDATSLFNDFGWQRLAAMNNWGEYFPGMRFNQFVYGQTGNWQEAMLQVHPASKLKEFLDN